MFTFEPFTNIYLDNFTKRHYTYYTDLINKTKKVSYQYFKITII